jgi:uncharacterized membrane protein YbhN (UPF0104 family)
MQAVFDAIDRFRDELSEIHWLPILLAVGCQIAKLACTSRAWRNVLAAAYPDVKVKWRKIFAAYVSGVGVNAIIPARGGDVVRVALAHRAIEGSSYTTIVSSTVVLTIVDSTMALTLFAWALTQNVLPSVDVLPDLPSFDYGWLFDGGPWSNALLIAIGAALSILFGWMWVRWRAFKARVAQAFWVFRPKARYLRTVAFWQLCDWGLRFTVIWLFLGGFGIDQTIRNVLLVQVTQSLATLVPATPGGIGTEQAFIVYVFRNAGIARSTLLAFSVGMKLVLTTVNVVVGFTAILLTLRTVRFRRAVAAEQAAAEAEDATASSPRG